MSDATVEGLQWHPEGHVAGRKGQVRKDPPREAACWLQVREEEGYGAERGLC